MVAGVVTLLVLAGPLAACNSRQSYCSTLEEDHKKLQSLAADVGKGEQAKFAATVRIVSQLRDQAPRDVSAEWDAYAGALQRLLHSVRASGADISAFRSGTRPPGVSQSDYATIQQASQELQSLPVRQAATSIEQHARQVCHVDLGTPGGADGGLG